MRKPYFIDTTLRDGEQAPGLVFSLKQKMVLCELLDKAGIPELEVGMPAMSNEEMAHLIAIAEKNFHFKRLGWCRANERDIHQAIASKVNGVHISFPVSQILQDAMNKDRSWVMDNVSELIHVARSEFEYVTIGAQDAGRADKSFLEDFASKVESLGASRIRLADTVGILNPFTTSALVASVHHAATSIPIEMHAHNDMGMATANTVAAFLSGANCLSVTVNGIGERAGNAALEEVAVALKISEKIDVPIDFALISQLSDLVSEMSGRPIPVDKPIIGRDVISHESGIHVNCLIKDQNTYQLFPAKMVGRKEAEIVFGLHSGKSSIRYILNRLNIKYNDKECAQLLEMVKEKASICGRTLDEYEVIKLYNELKLYCYG